MIAAGVRRSEAGRVSLLQNPVPESPRRFPIFLGLWPHLVRGVRPMAYLHYLAAFSFFASLVFVLSICMYAEIFACVS